MGGPANIKGVQPAPNASAEEVMWSPEDIDRFYKLQALIKQMRMMGDQIANSEPLYTNGINTFVAKAYERFLLDWNTIVRDAIDYQ